MKRIVCLFTLILALIALGACSDDPGDRSSTGDNDSEEPLSEEPEWHWLDVAPGETVAALVGTEEDGVFALSRTTSQAQLHVFDGENMQAVGLPLSSMGANLLAGRSGDALYATTRFAFSRSGMTVVYRFDGEQWTEFLSGAIASTEISDIEKLSVDAEGGLWMASASGLVHVRGPNDYQRISFSQSQLEFGEPFVSVATPPNPGLIMATSAHGSYHIDGQSPNYDASLWQEIVGQELFLSAEQEGVAVVDSPPGLMFFQSSGDYSHQPIEDLQPRNAILAASSQSSIWMLETLEDSDDLNRLWRIDADENISPFELPEDAPLLTDIAVVSDEDIWLATDDGRILRWVSPAAFSLPGQSGPTPSQETTITPIDLPSAGLSSPWIITALQVTNDGRLLAAGASNEVGAAHFILENETWNPFELSMGVSRFRSDDAGNIVAQGFERSAAVWNDPSFEVIWGLVDAVSFDGAGTLWASDGSDIGTLSDAASALIIDPDAPSVPQAWIAADGGGGEVWFGAGQWLASHVDGEWEQHSLGLAAGVTDIAWLAAGHVIAVGLNGNIYEIEAGEITSHSGVSSQNFEFITTANSRVFARAGGELFEYNDGVFSVVHFADFPDTNWRTVTGDSSDTLYFAGHNDNGESVLLRVENSAAE